MKAQKILRSTLVVAATSTFGSLVSAETVSLTNGEVSTLSGSSDTGAGNTYSYSAPSSGTNEQGGWIQWSSEGFTSDVSLGTSNSNATLSGTGLVGLSLKAGSSYDTVSVDLTNTTASSFSGQLTVLNQWNNSVNVKLSGDTWTNTEYVFAGRSRESSNTWRYVRGYGDTSSSKGTDTLTLTGATTLAGVSGFDKTVTSYRDTTSLWSLSSGSDINARERISVSTGGTVLTLAGTGTYAFYGTAGTSDAKLGIAKTGAGTQTFGGTNYFNTVSVSAGTLKLEGITTVSGSATVSGGTLSLDGTINLSSAITVSSSSGDTAVTVVKDSVVFNLVDSLKTSTSDASSDSTATYTLISGASSVENWTNLTTSNFTLSGESLSGRSTVNVGTAGQVTVSSVVASLVWGDSTSGTWDTTTTNKSWKNNDADDSFYTGDNVTFSTSGASITVSSGVSAGTVTISANTTLTGSSFNADSVTISGGTNSISSGFTTETFTVSGGTTTLTSTNSSYVSATSTTIASGAKLILGTETGATGLLRGSATVNGTLEFTAKDVTGYNGGSTALSSITVNSGGTVNLATSSGNNETFAGTLTLAGGSLTGNSGTIWDIFGSSTINVTGNGSKIGVNLRVRKDNATITISDGASLTVSGKIYFEANMSGSDTLKVSADGSGAFTFTGSSGSLGGGFYSKKGSLTVGDGTNASVLSVSRVEIGDAQSSSSNSKLEVKSGSTLKITGSTNAWSETGSYKSNSVVLGEWNDQTTATIAGTLLAQNAEIGLGDVGGSLTVSGTIAAKGIGQGVSGKASSGKFDLTLSDNGKIVLGESGIASVKTSGTATFNGGTVGLFSDTTTIAKNATLGSSTGTTFDTAKYSFNSDGNGVTQGTDGGTMTVSGVLSGSGKLLKTGAGTLVLSAANTFTGGVDISAGTLEVSNTNGLGSGSVSVASGATLKISVQSVSAGAVSFCEGAKFAISDSLITTSSETDSILVNLLVSNAITFGTTSLTSDNANTLVDNYFDTSSLGDTYKDYLRTWGYSNNTLSLTLAIPEPSAFGLLAGTFALAFAVSRRRRQKR